MPDTDTRTLDLDVEGMTCGSCAARVQKVLGKQAGVADATVNYATGRARIEITPEADEEQLAAAVERIGYRLLTETDRAEAARAGGDHDDLEAAAEAGWLRRATVALPLAAAVVVIAMFSGDFGMSTTGMWLAFA
ncbi:MAG: cation transporter, partial [Actinobacteria bacterium]|nr:cation transporter [Actinomycetota bacterium]